MRSCVRDLHSRHLCRAPAAGRLRVQPGAGTGHASQRTAAAFCPQSNDRRALRTPGAPCAVVLEPDRCASSLVDHALGGRTLLAEALCPHVTLRRPGAIVCFCALEPAGALADAVASQQLVLCLEALHDSPAALQSAARQLAALLRQLAPAQPTAPTRFTLLTSPTATACRPPLLAPTPPQPCAGAATSARRSMPPCSSAPHAPRSARCGPCTQTPTAGLAQCALLRPLRSCELSAPRVQTAMRVSPDFRRPEAMSPGAECPTVPARATVSRPWSGCALTQPSAPAQQTLGNLHGGSEEPPIAAAQSPLTAAAVWRQQFPSLHMSASAPLCRTAALQRASCCTSERPLHVPSGQAWQVPSGRMQLCQTASEKRNSALQQPCSMPLRHSLSPKAGSTSVSSSAAPQGQMGQQTALSHPHHHHGPPQCRPRPPQRPLLQLPTRSARSPSPPQHRSRQAGSSSLQRRVSCSHASRLSWPPAAAATAPCSAGQARSSPPSEQTQASRSGGASKRDANCGRRSRWSPCRVCTRHCLPNEQWELQSLCTAGRQACTQLTESNGDGSPQQQQKGCCQRMTPSGRLEAQQDTPPPTTQPAHHTPVRARRACCCQVLAESATGSLPRPICCKDHPCCVHASQPNCPAQVLPEPIADQQLQQAGSATIDLARSGLHGGHAVTHCCQHDAMEAHRDAGQHCSSKIASPRRDRMQHAPLARSQSHDVLGRRAHEECCAARQSQLPVLQRAMHASGHAASHRTPLVSPATERVSAKTSRLRELGGGSMAASDAGTPLHGHPEARTQPRSCLLQHPVRHNGSLLQTAVQEPCDLLQEPPLTAQQVVEPMRALALRRPAHTSNTAHADHSLGSASTRPSSLACGQPTAPRRWLPEVVAARVDATAATAAGGGPAFGSGASNLRDARFSSGAWEAAQCVANSDSVSSVRSFSACSKVCGVRVAKYVPSLRIERHRSKRG